MRTALLYLDDQYLRRFDATVVESGDGYVVLDRTAFYPGGGGQPPDSGFIEFGGSRIAVTEASKEDDAVVHRVQGAPPSGARIVGELDWDRRYAHMRLHTAIHLLDALILRRGTEGQITGGQIYDDRARVDFDWPEFSREALEGLVEEANREISNGRRVLARYVSRDEAMSIPNLARTAPGRELLSRLEMVRIIEIEGLDAQMDGGTHVSNLREIGRIAATRVENKGRRNKRVEFTLG